MLDGDDCRTSEGGGSSRATHILHEALLEGRVQQPNGEYRHVTANISAENSSALNHFVRERRPQLVVEIGMALGVSTLSILEALEANSAGRLISIDPYVNWQSGREVALHQVARAGLSHRHQHIEEFSYSALPQLLREGARPDLIYIDGCHDFEFAFTDFFYADKLTGPGGVTAFNDAGWPSVFKVIRFVQRCHRYRELDVGLPRVYEGRNLLFTIAARLQGRSRRDRYFEKGEA